jgi:hypothetical protein
MTALQELLANVEVGEWDTAMVFSAFDGKHLTAISQAYNGSLDAALSLFEAVLPDHRARLDYGRRFRAWVITPYNGKHDAYSTSIARALLIATIEVLIAQEDKT